MAPFDYIIIAIYFIVIFGFYFIIRRKMVSDEDFVLAGRKLSSSWVGLSAFASWIGLAGVFGTPENVYKYGLSGAWWFYGWLPGVLLMAYLLASRLRNRLHVTIADLVSPKQNLSIKVVASLVTSWNYLAWAAVQIFALKLILTTFTDMNTIVFVVIFFLIVVLYTMIGGMQFVVASDVIQAILFIVLLIIIAPFFALKSAGGWQNIYNATNDIPAFYTIFEGTGTKTLLIWFVSLVPAAFIDPGGLQRVFSACDPQSARKGLYISAVIYFIFGIAITFLGLAARTLFPDIEAQKAMPMLISHIMPVGLKGLSIAAFLAVAMSTADTALLVVSTTLQRDIYAHFRPSISNRERLIVNRIFILLLGIIALLIALKSQSVVNILLLGFSIYVPGLLLPVLASSYKWRLPSWAILFSIIFGAGGAAIWSLMKEPLVPAIFAGLILSSVPCLLGLFRRSP